MSSFYFHGVNAGHAKPDVITAITPAIFSAMAAPEQTQVILMMVDLRISVATMHHATGLDPQEMIRIGRTRHQVRAHVGHRAGAAPEVKCRPMKAKRARWPVSAERALLWFLTMGGTARISANGIEEAAGLGSGAGRYAMRFLVDNECLLVTEQAVRGRAPLYEMTDDGMAAARNLQAKAVADVD